MSEIQIDHEAAMRLANIGANAGNSTPHGKVSRAYIDSQRQLAAERARVEAVSDAFAEWESVRTFRNDINSHEWLALVDAMTGLE